MMIVSQNSLWSRPLTVDPEHRRLARHPPPAAIIDVVVDRSSTEQVFSLSDVHRVSSRWVCASSCQTAQSRRVPEMSAVLDWCATPEEG